jgi:hypothetical protein
LIGIGLTLAQNGGSARLPCRGSTTLGDRLTGRPSSLRERMRFNDRSEPAHPPSRGGGRGKADDISARQVADEPRATAARHGACHAPSQRLASSPDAGCRRVGEFLEQAAKPCDSKPPMMGTPGFLTLPKRADAPSGALS